MLEASGRGLAGGRAQGRELERYGATSGMAPPLWETLIAMCEECGRSALDIGSGHADFVIAAHVGLQWDGLDGLIMN